MGPITARASLVLLAAASALGCASPPRPRAAPAREAPAATAAAEPTRPPPDRGDSPRAPDALDSGLAFDVEPLDAVIAVDGRTVGTVADLASSGGLLRLAPGIYQVSLKATGFVTWRAEVALRAGTETIRVKLTRKP